MVCADDHQIIAQLISRNNYIKPLNRIAVRVYFCAFRSTEQRLVKASTADINATPPVALPTISRNQVLPSSTYRLVVTATQPPTLILG